MALKKRLETNVKIIAPISHNLYNAGWTCNFVNFYNGRDLSSVSVGLSRVNHLALGQVRFVEL